jgi:hypothetical protein
MYTQLGNVRVREGISAMCVLYSIYSGHLYDADEYTAGFDVYIAAIRDVRKWPTLFAFSLCNTAIHQKQRPWALYIEREIYRTIYKNRALSYDGLCIYNSLVKIPLVQREY